MSICNRCARRKCRSRPTRKLEREYCYKYVKPQEGFPLFEIAIDTSPLETLQLLEQHQLDWRKYAPKI